MKQALLLLTAGLILVGGVFVFADRAGVTSDFSKLAVRFMDADAAVSEPKPDGTCDPGQFFNEDGKCEDENKTVGANDTNGSSDGDFDWFFPEGGFVPCGKRGAEGVAIQEPCNICHAAELGQNILNFLVTTVMPFLAILFAAIGGFLIMTAGGSEKRYKDGRDQLVRVAVGVLIVLLAWAGISFIMKTFFNDEVTGSWYEFQCSVEQEPDVLDFTPQAWKFDTSEGGIPIPPGEEPTGTAAIRLSATEAKQFLESRGIEVKPGAQLEGVRASTLNELVVLKRLCSCTIVVTDATGRGHSSGFYSHANGYKIDVRSQGEGAALTTFIQQSWQRVGTREFDGAPQYRNPETGHIYALESDHWDILVIPR